METLKNNKQGRDRLFELFTESNGTCTVEIKELFDTVEKKIVFQNIMTIGNTEVIISDKFYKTLKERNILIKE